MENENQIKKSSNNIHDSFFKSLFSVKENLTDLLKGTLPSDILKKLKPETLEYEPTEYVDQELAPYFKDISCNMFYGDDNIKIALLYEHKSYPDKNIHLQLLRYILNVWEDQVANKQKLNPIITVVFYHGKRKWTDSDFVDNIPTELKRFVPLFDYVLFDTKDIEDHAIIQHFKHPGVKVAIWFMKRSDNLIGFIQNNPELAREMFENIPQIDKTIFQKIALYLYKVSGMESGKIEEIMGTISTNTRDAFEEVKDQLRNEGMEQGIEQGLEQGMERGMERGAEQSTKRIALNMIKEGARNDFIHKMTGLSHIHIQKLRKENTL